MSQKRKKPTLVAYRVFTDGTERGIIWAANNTPVGYLSERLKERVTKIFDQNGSGVAFMRAKKITLESIFNVNYVYLPKHVIAYGVHLPNGQTINA